MDQRSVFDSNRSATQRMHAIAARLSDAALLERMPNGWTVAATLAHLAFWDQRVLLVMELAEQQGRVTPSIFDDSLNDILNIFLQEIPARRAADMAVSIAGQLDARIESWPSKLLEAMDAINHRWVDRSLHRNMHLDDIDNLFHP